MIGKPSTRRHRRCTTLQQRHRAAPDRVARPRGPIGPRKDEHGSVTVVQVKFTHVFAAALCLMAPPLAAQSPTTRIVSAANAFLATLDAQQKQGAQFAFTDNRSAPAGPTSPLRCRGARASACALNVTRIDRRDAACPAARPGRRSCHHRRATRDVRAIRFKGTEKLIDRSGTVSRGQKS